MGACEAQAAFLKEASASNSAECILWPFWLDKDGYGGTKVDGKTTRAHRVSLVARHGLPPTARHESAHNCGNASCVNGSHLRWATPKENIADKVLHGTSPDGERAYQAKLNEGAVRIIRRAPKTVSLPDLAFVYGVHKSTVHDARIGKTWKHLQ